jgi:hypothetical protein
MPRLCIVGDPEDRCATYIAWLARQRGAEVLTLAEHEFGERWTFALRGADGVIRTDGEVLRLSELTGALVRFHPQPAVPPSLGVPGEAEAAYLLERRCGLQWLLDHAPFPVINRPAAGPSAGSKPYQMLWLTAAGFTVPRWLVTNRRLVAAAFAGSCRHGAVVKACSGLRSRVRRVDHELLARLDRPTAPVVIQEYVPGCDVRVHTVGCRVFATRIRAGGVDHRFESAGSELDALEAPPAVAHRCLATAAQEGLTLAGFDFRLDTDGRWWCLEMNPAPTFLPYEAATAQPIGDAILDVLGVAPPIGSARSPFARWASSHGAGADFEIHSPSTT